MPKKNPDHLITQWIATACHLCSSEVGGLDKPCHVIGDVFWCGDCCPECCGGAVKVAKPADIDFERFPF